MYNIPVQVKEMINVIKLLVQITTRQEFTNYYKYNFLGPSTCTCTRIKNGEFSPFHF